MQMAGIGALRGLSVKDIMAELGPNCSLKSFGTRMLGTRETHVVQIAVPKFMLMKYWIGCKDFQLYKFDAQLDMSAMFAGMMDAMAPGKGGKAPRFTMGVTATVDALKVDQPIPSNIFTFKVPKGAKIVEEPSSAATSEDPSR